MFPCYRYIEMEKKEFETFVGSIRHKLLMSAYRHLGNTDDAEDVVQDTVLKLWAMRCQLGEHDSPEKLAMLIVHRLCLNNIRNAMRSGDMKDVAYMVSPEEHYISCEEDRRIMEAVETLPDKQQMILRMKHIEGFETFEIAHITGMKEDAVRANLSRARKKIMKYFGL